MIRGNWSNSNSDTDDDSDAKELNSNCTFLVPAQLGSHGLRFVKWVRCCTTCNLLCLCLHGVGLAMCTRPNCPRPIPRAFAAHYRLLVIVGCTSLLFTFTRLRSSIPRPRPRHSLTRLRRDQDPWLQDRDVHRSRHRARGLRWHLTEFALSSQSHLDFVI